MDPVTGADRGAVTVARDDKYVDVGACQFQSSRDRKRTAMDAVEPIGIHVVGEATGATDTRDKSHLFGFELFFCQQTLDRVQGAEVTTA